MNITIFSPALVLFYVFVLLSILMDVDLKSFGKTQRWILLFTALFFCAANHMLLNLMGHAGYVSFLILFMHLPTFLLFLYVARRGVIKTAFMILTALVFTTPTVLISNLVLYLLPADSSTALLLSNLISYALMLLLAQFVFRSGFNYLLSHGSNQFFLLFSLVPLIYYAYVLIAINIDSFSGIGLLARLTPHFQVFLFYFLLPYIYKSLSEKMSMQSAQDALQQQLAFTKDQITLLNESNTQMAVYRHDMRHHILLLEGLLSSGKIQQAQEFLKTVMTDLDRLTPKRFCENDTVNLLCSSYHSKAQRLGIQLKINALLPKSLPLSDTELCSLISNGLENAMRAVSQPEVPDKWVAFYCEVKKDKLFLEIQNPYAGQIVMRNGLPVSTQDGHGHGYGCRSIQTIAQRNSGLCSFKTENGLFTLRLMFPLPA